MHKIPKWQDTLWKSCDQCCKILKVCVTILGHNALKVSGSGFVIAGFEKKYVNLLMQKCLWNQGILTLLVYI